MKSFLTSYKFRYTLYIIVFALLALFRHQLDSPSPYITSDGEIKYYQSHQYMSGAFQFECHYPARSIDPDFKYYPFDIPWGYLNTAGFKCVSQYPPFFSYLGTIAMLLFNDHAALYISLIFILINIFIADYILISAGVSSLLTAFASVILFSGTHLILSSIDYSEMSLYHTFILLSIFALQKTLKTSESESDIQSIKKYFKIFTEPSFLLGFFLTVALFIRTEMLMFGGLLLIFSILLRPASLPLPRILVNAFTGAIIGASLFVIYNLVAFGSPLDIRAQTFVDAAGSTGSDRKFNIAQKIYIVSGYLFKTEDKRGLLYAFPLFYVFLIFFKPSIFKRQSEFVKISFISGVSFVFLGAFLTPAIGGIQNFGLRYLDTGFISFFLASVIIINKQIPELTRKLRWGAIFLIVVLLLPVYKFTKTGLKTLKGASSLYQEGQKIFGRAGDSYIVHKSLATVYMIGYSYLRQKHLLVYEDGMYRDLIHKFKETNVNTFMTIELIKERELLISIPKSLYYKHKTNITYVPEGYQLKETQDIAGYRIDIYSNNK